MVMWQYNNVRFLYSNPVDSVFNKPHTIPFIRTYIKSKFALMEAIRFNVNESYLGAFAEIDPRSVKHDPPIKF